MSKFNANSKCTIIVSSCDSYSDLWIPYLNLLKLYWPNCPYKINLCIRVGF